MLDRKNEDYIPETIFPRRLAKLAACLRGKVPLSGMSRLAAAVSATGELTEMASVELSFDREALTMIGTIKAQLPMVCQRCLDLVNLEVVAQVAQAILWSESQAVFIPNSLDPLIVAENHINLYETIEDELILALPIVPYHAEKACGTRSGVVYNHPTEQISNDSNTRWNSPFKDLLKEIAKKVEH